MKYFYFVKFFFVSPTRFERVTPNLEGLRSIQLSYGDKYYKVSIFFATSSASAISLSDAVLFVCDNLYASDISLA